MNTLPFWIMGFAVMLIAWVRIFRLSATLESVMTQPGGLAKTKRVMRNWSVISCAILITLLLSPVPSPSKYEHQSSYLDSGTDIVPSPTMSSQLAIENCRKSSTCLNLIRSRTSLQTTNRCEPMNSIPMQHSSRTLYASQTHQPLLDTTN